MAKKNYDVDFGGLVGFPNKYKKNEKQPDYTGQLKTEDGALHDFALWVKTSKSGIKYLSGRVTPVEGYGAVNSDTSNPKMFIPNELPATAPKSAFPDVSDIDKEVDDIIRKEEDVPDLLGGDTPDSSELPF